MRYLIFLIVVLFFQACSNSSKIEVKTLPEGAKVYDKNSNTFMGRSPLELTYLYDNDPDTPKCEKLPPLTAIWGNNDAIITERDIIVCQGKDYIVTINQNSFKRPKNLKLIENEKEWKFRPYLGTSIISSNIKLDILDSTKTNFAVNDSGYLYKIGFIDNDNNRLEVNYTLLQLDERDLNLYSLDTIIPITSLRVKLAEPYFKFGLGYFDYSYNEQQYSSAVYMLGVGVLGYISKNIEVELGLSNTQHINYSSIAHEVGFKGVEGGDTKINLNNILMGVNLKF